MSKTFCGTARDHPKGSFSTQRLSGFPTWSWTSVNTLIEIATAADQNFRTSLAAASIDVDSRDARVTSRRDGLISDTGAIAEDSLAIDLSGPIVMVRLVRDNPPGDKAQDWRISNICSVDEKSTMSTPCHRGEVFLDVLGEHPLLAEVVAVTLPAVFIGITVGSWEYLAFILLNEQYTKRVGLIFMEDRIVELSSAQRQRVLDWLEQNAMIMTVTLT